MVVRFTWSGVHKGALDGIPATGMRVRGSGQSITRVADGRVCEAWINWDALGLMQQLGVVTAHEGMQEQPARGAHNAAASAASETPGAGVKRQSARS